MHSILPHEENPALREMAHDIPLSDITSSPLKRLIADMKALLAKEDYGVALAAPQVGESLRLFIVSGKAIQKRSAKYADADLEKNLDLSQEDGVYINPVLQKMSRGKKDKHEGCLSVRGVWGLVPRAEKMTITYYDEHGAKNTRGTSGFLAHIFQHELDHLQGVLYIDKATKVYQDELTKGEK